MTDPWRDTLDRLADEYLHDELSMPTTQEHVVMLLMLREVRDILRRIESLMTVP